MLFVLAVVDCCNTILPKMFKRFLQFCSAVFVARSSARATEWMCAVCLFFFFLSKCAALFKCSLFKVIVIVLVFSLIDVKRAVFHLSKFVYFLLFFSI